MRKKLLLTTTAIIFAVASLTGCGHQHTWQDATCTEPKTCTECGKTEGEALGHRWTDATCTEPKTCSICKEAEGSATDTNGQTPPVRSPRPALYAKRRKDKLWGIP